MSQIGSQNQEDTGGEGGHGWADQIPPKRYRIGEIAQHTGLSRQTLHNYTRWGLIREAGRTAGGHRLYEEGVFGRLARVVALKPSHTIDQIRLLLDKQYAGQAA